MLSEPSGPLQVRAWPLIEISTPLGTSTGAFPILLMMRFRCGEGLRRVVRAGSLDQADDFAAEVLLAAGPVGEDSARGGEDGDAEAADDRLELALAQVDAAAGGAHA